MKSYERKRFNLTIGFLKKHIPIGSKILDLGVDNDLAQLMRDNGYNVVNTCGDDLDTNASSVSHIESDCVTGFEILEHLLAPLNVLMAIKANRIVLSIPLKLWFTSAYWNNVDKRDRHYHEFEVKQFNWLLERSGWEIVDSQLWKYPSGKIGIRPLLRYFYPRYYIVYCKRSSNNAAI